MRGRSLPGRKDFEPSHLSVKPGVRASVPRANENQIMHPLLLSALIQIESNGNDLAKGRHGELGALQIKPILVRDVNRLMGTHYTHAQVTNRATATFIANAYFRHYGRNLSDESLARLWQGGPRGPKKTIHARVRETRHARARSAAKCKGILDGSTRR